MFSFDLLASRTVIVVTGVVVFGVIALLFRELILARRARPTVEAKARPIPSVVAEPAVEDDVTKMAPKPRARVPKKADEHDPGWESVSQSRALTLFTGESGQAVDEPTGETDAILLWAAGQSDVGKRRVRNDDSYAVLPEHDVYVVADGMGGYAAGDIASKLAVETIVEAFATGVFGGEVNPDRPTLGHQLVGAIEAANTVIWRAAEKDSTCSGMGTTLVAARFARKKQRVYIGNVGDSRCYRLRQGALKLLTVDHTLAQKGVGGPLGANLRRALGVAPQVKVDLVIDVPEPHDVYLVCSDGLTKLVSDETIASIVRLEDLLQVRVEKLVAAANSAGGRDNITVILIAVEPKGSAVT